MEANRHLGKIVLGMPAAAGPAVVA
jgi:hypothetical protein